MSDLTAPENTQPLHSANVHLMDFDPQGLRDWLAKHGQPPFRAKQIFNWLYKHDITTPSAMPNIGKATQALLETHCTTALPNMVDGIKSEDGTQKWLLQLASGQWIETVFIPEKKRGTLCISSQVGCALACRFCATGLQGLNRNLKTHEILAQVWLARRALRQQNPEQQMPITNVVFMGMGEPLMNEKAVYPALKVLLSDDGFGLSKYRVTVSTSGIVPAMQRLRSHSPCALAISLHAPNDNLRDTLVPINQSYPLDMLIEACRSHFKHDHKRYITLEYIMLAGVNDTVKHAKQLIHIASQFPCKINLIPYNTVEGLPYAPSTSEDIAAFQNKIKSAGLVCTIRQQRGDPIAAACGQLAGQVQDRTKKTLNASSNRKKKT